MKILIEGKMDIIYLIYGFCFMFMGLSIVMQNCKRSRFKLAKIINLLAAFGIIHGLHEWFDMLALHHFYKNPTFYYLRVCTLFISYLFLLEFGRKIINFSTKHFFIFGKWVTWFFCSLCLLFAYSDKTDLTIWIRYFLALPAGLLTGIGFILYFKNELKTLEELKLSKYFYVSGFAFILYSILGGIITNAASFFPASYLNIYTFERFSGLPVELFRAFCALLAAWGVWHILEIFNWEFSSDLLNEITKRKEAEKGLRLFRDLLNESNDAVFIIDIKTSKFLDFNIKAYKSLGYTKEQLSMLGVIDIECKLPNLEMWLEHVEVLKKEGKALFEGEHLRKDGSTFPVEVSIQLSKMTEGQYMIAVARDISERKQAQENYKKLFEKASDGIFLLKETGEIVSVNEAFASLHGYTKEEMIGMNLKDLDEQETAKLLPERLKRILEGEVFKSEVSHYHKDGRIIHLEVSANSILVGKEKMIIGFHRDIGDRKKAEQALRQQKDFIELVINALKYPFYVIDRNYTIVLSNKAAKNKGVDKGDYCFKATHHVEGPCKDEHGCPLREVLKKNKSVVIEHIHTDKFGEEQIVEVHGDPIFDENGNVFQMIEYVIDVTARRKAEQALTSAYEKIKQTQEELIQSSKMAAMGQLAAGISHELNQPLAGIKVIVQNLLKNLKNVRQTKEDLQDINHQADRMDNIISNVRFFARKAKFSLQEIDIHKPIEDSLKLLNTQFKVQNITIKKELSSSLPKIMGDDNQLQQIFINLLTNAQDAIMSSANSNGGIIKVTTSVSEDKNNILIAYEDNGCGISKDTLNEIFNPFFTTKAPDRGMGLGLSIAYRIMENHNGQIEVQSQEGKGTKVILSLPVYSQ